MVAGAAAGDGDDDVGAADGLLHRVARVDVQAGGLLHLVDIHLQELGLGVPNGDLFKIAHPGDGQQLAAGLPPRADDAELFDILPGQVLDRDGAGRAGAAAGDPGAVQDADQGAGIRLKEHDGVHADGQALLRVLVIAAGGRLDGDIAAAHVQAALEVDAGAGHVGDVHRHEIGLDHLAGVEGTVPVLHRGQDAVQVDERGDFFFI